MLAAHLRLKPLLITKFHQRMPYGSGNMLRKLNARRKPHAAQKSDHYVSS